ncbi:MAG TPA: UvrB/UvrC motif-containing protein [Spirochaetota bacterium]|nr:UvrB/UvrC motif-containing protein [Spirochaetota bacterium]
MKCDICNKRESTIHIKEIVNGESVGEINICLRCAAKRGFDLFEGNIETLIDEVVPEFNFDSKPISDAKYKIDYNCPYCGNDFTDFIETLDAKCNKCYEVFDDIIENIIYEKNNSVEYKGKSPGGFDNSSRARSKLRDLRRKLKEYVNNEDYANAAVLRDQIKSIKEAKKDELFNDKNRE